MYNVCYLLPNREQGTVLQKFDTEESAWEFIHEVMLEKDHPTFMWIVKVGERSVQQSLR